MHSIFAAALGLLPLFAYAAEPPAEPIRVALYAGDGARPVPVQKILAADPAFQLTMVNAEDIRRGALDKADVVIFPGGRGLPQSQALGPEGHRALKKFLADGGGYLGLCAGAYLATTDSPGALSLINAKVRSPKWDRGITMLKIELTAAGKILYGDAPGLLEIRYENGPVVEPAGIADLPEYEVLAWFRSEIAENGTPPGIQIDSPAILTAPYGKGRVLISSPHPELTPALNDWIKRNVRYLAKTQSQEPVSHSRKL
jgi:glutamine amidotransferase-like uncharacterized protein